MRWFPCLPLPDRTELPLFTVLTPLYITLIYDVMSHVVCAAFSALLAVIMPGLFAYDRVTDHFWGRFAPRSFLISVSLSEWWGINVRWRTRPMPQHNALRFYQGVLVAAVAWVAVVTRVLSPETTPQWSI